MVRRLNAGKAIICLITLLAVFQLPPERSMAGEPLVLLPTDTVGSAGSLASVSSQSLPTTVHLTFALKSASKLNAASFVASLTDPSSANYHKWLTPKEFGEKFGAAASDINDLSAYLTKNGFTGIKVWHNNLFVSAQTTTTNAESLFKISVKTYKRSPSEVARGLSTFYYAPDRQPAVEADVAGHLNGIFGLSNVGEHRPYFHVLDEPLANPKGGLNPSDLAQIYNGAALQAAGNEGDGITIGIFSPTAYKPSDINAFLSYNNLTGTKISVVNVNGGNTDLTDEVEACLDIESVVGQAPGSNIDVYEGPNDGSFDIFNQMADDDPNIVTESYGADENSVSAQYADDYETIREQMAAEGISIIVASGDNGAYDSVDQTTVTTSVDATSAYVTAIGGTELLPFTNDTWDGEIGWTYNDGTLGNNAGSGGGLSIYYPEPSWQTGPGVSNGSSNGMRQIPDVSTLASTPFYSFYTQGAFSEYGGTSCACQFFGGTLALIEEQIGSRLGNIDPELYNYGANDSPVYHDITSGNNGVYQCTPNWDFVTGWGSVDFAKLALALANTGVAPTPVHTFNPGLQMFSTPFTFSSGATAAEVLGGLVTPTGSPAYVIASYAPTESAYVLSPTPPANVPQPGQGYWARFNSHSGGSLAAIGTAVTSPTFSVTLSPGWNLIGDPYAGAVSIDALSLTTSSGVLSFADAVNAGDLQPDLYDYNGSLYVAHTSGDSLEPYDGYWINVASHCTLTFTSP